MKIYFKFEIGLAVGGDAVGVPVGASEGLAVGGVGAKLGALYIFVGKKNLHQNKKQFSQKKWYC